MKPLAAWPLALLTLLLCEPSHASAQSTCPSPLSPAQVRAALDASPARILGFEATDTAADLRQLTRELPCLEAPLSPEVLARLWFLRGLARYYAIEEGKPSEVGGEDVVVSLFAIAHRVDPTFQWDTTTLGDLGQDRWLLATQAPEPIASTQLELPETTITLTLDGAELPPGEPRMLSEGPYLLQWQRDGRWSGGWLEVQAEQPAALLPPTLVAALEAARPQEPAPGTHADPQIDLSAAAPSPGTVESDDSTVGGQAQRPDGPSQAVRPPPPARTPPASSATVLFTTWRLPQLYSGPEVAFERGLGRRLGVEVAAGAAAGPWKGCPTCLSPAGAFVILPVRAELHASLRAEQALSFKVGLAWQGLFGGGFGLTGEPLSPSAQGLNAAATALLGKGDVKAVLRLSSGYLLSPASIAGNHTTVGFGLTSALGGRR